ncbi:hypothetical protein M8J77_012505 [Diaphorina citri]|nr:hypothetical protein M8J77_012505 [Diaphorina citri]
MTSYQRSTSVLQPPILRCSSALPKPVNEAQPEFPSPPLHTDPTQHSSSIWIPAFTLSVPPAVVPDSTALRLLGFNPKVNTSPISSDFFDDGPLKKNLHPSQPSYGLFSATFGFAKPSQVPLVKYSSSSSSSSSTSQPTVIDDVPASQQMATNPVNPVSSTPQPVRNTWALQDFITWISTLNLNIRDYKKAEGEKEERAKGGDGGKEEEKKEVLGAWGQSRGGKGEGKEDMGDGGREEGKKREGSK